MKKDKKIISVVGASSGCGATYVGTRLAIEMGKLGGKVTFLENYSCDCPRCERTPLIYYDLDLYKNRRFADFFFDKATGRPVDNRVNYDKGVNWVIRTPSSPVCKITPHDVAGEYIIWDNHGELQGSHLILCVLNPEKKHLMAGLDTIKYCRDKLPAKTFFIFNQIVSDASSKAAEDFLKIKADFRFEDNKNEHEQTFKLLAKQILTLF